MHTRTAPHPAWPDTVDLDIAARTDPHTAVAVIGNLPARGQQARIPAPVRFGHDSHVDATVLSVLQAAAANFVTVDWRLDGDLLWERRAMVHLPPPQPDGSALVERWRADYRYGLCTHRLGPGFVSVRDVRPGGPKRELTVPATATPDFLELAEQGLHPGTRPAARRLFDQLVGHDLARYLDTDTGIVLPVHATRWPIPGRPGATARTGYHND